MREIHEEMIKLITETEKKLSIVTNSAIKLTFVSNFHKQTETFGRS